MNKNFLPTLIMLLTFGLLLAACAPQDADLGGSTPQVAASATPADTPTPTPIPTTLVVCLGSAPNTLYPYGDPNQAALEVLQAVYDGPIDARGYTYQPVLLDSLPDIAGGTAILQTVQVHPGDIVLDSQGNVTELDFGTFIRPAGCFSGECAAPFDGDAVEMDQMAALFSLRSGIKWSDGAPVSVGDALFGYSLAAVSVSVTDQYKVARTLSYESVDETTIKWTGIPGFIDPNYQSNFWLPAPQHLWGALTPEELAADPLAMDTPLGYGPFVVVERQADTITLQRNPNYYRATEGLPLVDNLVFRVVGQDPQTNLDMLRTGECDLLDPAAAAQIDPAEVTQAAGQGELLASWANGSGWALLNFGIVPLSYDDGYEFWSTDRQNFFGDVRTRQAIAMCIDRQQIVDTATQGIAVVMDTYIPPDHPLFDPDVPVYAFDQEGAAALLEEIGWTLANSKDGIRMASNIKDVRNNAKLALEFLYVEHPQNTQIAEMIASDLANCGIQVTLASMTAEEMFATGAEGPVFGRNFDLAYFSWQTSAAPPCQLYLSEGIPGKDDTVFPYKWGGWNASGWRNETYDTACKLALGSAPGQETYSVNHALAQKIFAEELPVLPLFTFQQVTLARPDLCGLQLDPTAGFLWNVENIGYGQVCP